MICIKVDIPQEICDINDTVCILAFKTRIDKNKFIDETSGMLKNDR